MWMEKAGAKDSRRRALSEQISVGLVDLHVGGATLQGGGVERREERDTARG